MVTTDSRRGRVALMVAHCAGMVDLVALPVWVGTLIGHYGFDPQQAGGLATLFLAAAVLASVALAPRFGRLPRRAIVAAGFGVAALAFFGASLRQDFAAMALLHALAGLAAGSALSVTHGTIARSANPHRLFAIVGIALGVFAIAFFAVVPPLLAALGGVALFRVFAAVMVVAALVALFAFPHADGAPAGGSTPPSASAPPMPRAVWFGIVGIACMGLVQAMTFAFLERVGTERGFGLAAVTGVLVALSFVNLFPAALAALLERRLSARAVLLAGPVLQAVLVALIMQSTVFAPYAAAASVFAAVMIFTHTFGFGQLARLDASGRVLAATPAMLMTGAAIGPILGGTLVKTFGYGSLAVAAAAIAAIAVACFSRLPVPAAVASRSALA
ncbi:MFS transporter [Ideonella sp.]|uniref:MFS transporter n=1 Tax=Ideonella sp. TaxID=1929293 RepID=UPI002B493A98|nr:MFS transporter [Ideonella sp.]HJV70470.1 MFS transporter [Ideonella sp.]